MVNSYSEGSSRSPTPGGKRAGSSEPSLSFTLRKSPLVSG